MFTLPERFNFQPGQAVYRYRYQGMNRPYTYEPAVIVSVNTAPDKRFGIGPKSIGIFAASSPKVQRTSYRFLVYRGYCPICPVPPVLIDGQLICPQCGGSAIDAIAPDALLCRWYPPFHQLAARTVREQIRMTAEGCVTDWRDARKALDAADAAAWEAACERVGVYRTLPLLSVDLDSEGAGGYWLRRRAWEEAQVWAHIGDDAAFLEAYLRAGGYTPQARENLERFLDMVTEILEGRDELPPPRPRPDAPALRIVRPDDDSEPSGADATTRWLEQQFKRAA